MARFPHQAGVNGSNRTNDYKPFTVETAEFRGGSYGLSIIHDWL